MNPVGKESRKKILFISSNDGSDMRINKEVKSLFHAGAEVYFLGVEGNPESCFIRPFCAETRLVKGPRNSPLSMLRLVLAAYQLVLSSRISSIHIINEQLMVFFYPLLFFKHTVLDLFDSVFLKWNKPSNAFEWLKRLVYLPVNSILVTDERRLGLMPDFARPICRVLPNYPLKRTSKVRQERSAELCILFNGWMGKNRGTEIVEGLLRSGLPVKIIMAGWFSDEHTRKLLEEFPDSIDFRGVVPQETALEWAENEADYILCVYAPINTNNINASPNKIYDAIHTGTPLIVNAEIGIARFVEEHKLGHILPAYQENDFRLLHATLLQKRNSFHWPEKLRVDFSWENTESVLLKSHGLP